MIKIGKCIADKEKDTFKGKIARKSVGTEHGILFNVWKQYL